jgi:two-component system NarL family response regulator
MNPLRILIVDDHFVVRSGIAASLDTEEDLKVVGEAETPEQAEAKFEKFHPDVVLMDLRLLGGSGIDTTATICNRWPNAKVLMFTTFEGDEHVYRAMQAGARGYILKTSPRAELLEAIRAVARGERYLPMVLANRVADRVADEDLSAREVEVLQQIAAGLSNKEIASELGLSDETVDRHVSNVFVKLKVNDRKQAASEAVRRGVIAV